MADPMHQIEYTVQIPLTEIPVPDTSYLTLYNQSPLRVNYPLLHTLYYLYNFSNSLAKIDTNDAYNNLNDINFRVQHTYTLIIPIVEIPICMIECS